MKRLIATVVMSLSTAVAAAQDAPKAALPPDVVKSGTLKVAIVPNYPPMEFKNPETGQLTGFDVDLGDALAKKLGVKLAWQETSFDQMMPALATGRVDAILSGMTDLPTRHDTATFVDYLRSGPQFFVRKARAPEFTGMASLCGKKAGASRRTSFPREIAAWSEQNCKDNPVVFVGTEGSADARTQLKQGRIDAAVQGNETLPYVMGLEPDTYLALGTPIALQYTGIAIPVKETSLQQAVAGALDALIADGTYKALLEKWKLTENGVDKALINGAK
ncbi:polar amino acid transport system substrate-binding protein [Methylobacterium sp. 174MFSha1.1]|uniref:ABC transporter substrate-binding protein n=1 Tax=Methylobacterium sp. 174MFSha1.1 TaxID=1502749 RepID=UPI0008E2ECFE|nr:ABC transporter substrate-binding protein [Methylobacterium sp. 174MFSha1.1]SFU49916.1 polar amino acid transport system substrate-binding protein [Methylobacterium sp. 174MFSha1.1]